jgi:hypothetical protein
MSVDTLENLFERLELFALHLHIRLVRRLASRMPSLGVSSLDLGPLALQAASFLFRGSYFQVRAFSGRAFS